MIIIVIKLNVSDVYIKHINQMDITWDNVHLKADGWEVVVVTHSAAGLTLNCLE